MNRTEKMKNRIDHLRIKGVVQTAIFALTLTGMWVMPAQTVLGDPTAPNGGYQPAPEADPTPTNAPIIILLQTAKQLNELVSDRAIPQKVALHLRKASQQTNRSLTNYLAIDPKLSLSMNAVHLTLSALEHAQRVNSDPSLAIEIGRMQLHLSQITRDTAEKMIDVALSAGVDREKLVEAQASMDKGDLLALSGDYEGAAKHYNKTLKLDNQLVFDYEMFESNVRAALDTQTIGYTAALVQNGNLINSATWAFGSRRTGADAPFIFSSTGFEMNIASISKMITAAAVLHRLQTPVLGKMVSIDDPIGPYLPHEWARGDGVDDITFRELMTHRSGLANNNTQGATSFSALQNFVATDITMGLDSDGMYPYLYQNANFALFRIILPYMNATLNIENGGQHCNDTEEPTLCPDATANSTAAAYRAYVQCSIFRPMGLSQPDIDPLDLDLTCEGPDLAQNPDEGWETRLYWQPTPALLGADPGDWTLIGGAGGWYMSAIELARFLAYLQYDNTFLNKESRALMFENYLGFMDSDSLFGNYSFGSGLWGAYRMHGGDLCYPAQNVPAGQNGCASAFQPRGVDTCAANFPGGIQAVLLINSTGGNYPYQCTVLKNAYEGAFAAK